MIEYLFSNIPLTTKVDVLKILVIASAIDLSLGIAVPAWWQLLKGLYELGCDIVVVPYVGGRVESFWWKSYQNPCKFESLMVNYLVRKRKIFHASGSFSRTTKSVSVMRSLLKEKTVQVLTRNLTLPKWRKNLLQILNAEKDICVTLVCSAPLNQIKGIPNFIRRIKNVPVIFYEMDMPDCLPHYSASRLAFSHYINADLAEYDAFVTNSEGVVPELKVMGVRRIFTLHFGVDPSIYAPLDLEQDIDVFFYGHGAAFREKWISEMINKPSEIISDAKFLVGGQFSSFDLGKAKNIKKIPISSWRRYASRSKINLNITRKHHAEIYCSSTSRIFELASLGCCIVSNPVKGLDKWFKMKEEVVVVNNEKEAIETYRSLLSSNEKRHEMGQKARKRVLAEHTHLHMAKKMLKIIESLTK